MKLYHGAHTEFVPHEGQCYTDDEDQYGNCFTCYRFLVHPSVASDTVMVMRRKVNK